MSGIIRAMNKKIDPWFVLFAVILIVIGCWVGYLSKNFVMRQYDAARLARFAHRIADADHIVATTYDSISLTITGDSVAKVLRAVSSAVSARMPDAEFTCKYGVTATFYKGTNVLGGIEMYKSLFLLNPNQPPFGDSSRVLDTTINTPVEEALRESYRKSAETK